ncbi:hypothetical protein JL720_13109 [Aureococcus anophagefferens]|nr:hypothetical protein JL720_13109 [Aureococcus anophagefferens]
MALVADQLWSRGAKGSKYALADISDYHERVRNAEAGAAGLMGELIENYMKPLKVSLDPAALVFGDRLTYAASVGELTAIIGKRLKLIGREVRILFTHHILVEEAMAKPGHDDELDLMIVDKGTVNRGELPLDPPRQKMGVGEEVALCAVVLATMRGFGFTRAAVLAAGQKIARGLQLRATSSGGLAALGRRTGTRQSRARRGGGRRRVLRRHSQGPAKQEHAGDAPGSRQERQPRVGSCRSIREPDSLSDDDADDEEEDDDEEEGDDEDDDDDDDDDEEEQDGEI